MAVSGLRWQMRVHKKRRHSGRRAWATVLLFAVLTVLGLFMALPLIYSVINSFKPVDELFAFPPRFFVVRPTSSNYFLLFKLATNMWVPFSRYLFNSLFVSVVATGGNVLIASMAAYPLAKFQLRVKWIFNFVVVALLFNTTILWLPQYVILAKTGMLDTYLVYILPQLATPLGLFLMKQFMEQVPTPLIESATIDGAGQIRTLWSIVMPQVKPAWMTLLVFSFQGVWNQTQANMVFSEELKLVNLAVKQIMAGGTARYGVAMAGSIVLIIPPILLFVFTQSQGHGNHEPFRYQRVRGGCALKILCRALCALLLARCALPAGSSGGGHPVRRLRLQREGNAVAAPVGYVPQKVVSGRQLPPGTLGNAADLFVDEDGLLNVADTDSGRILVLDEELRYVKTLTFRENGEERDLPGLAGVFIRGSGAERTYYAADPQNKRVIIADSGLNIRQVIERRTARCSPATCRSRPPRCWWTRKAFSMCWCPGCTGGPACSRRRGSS